MIKAFRVAGRVILEVQSTSAFEGALLESTAEHSITLKTLEARSAGVSRYRLSKSDEGRFSHCLGVVFRRWPRRKREKRVLAEIRRLRGVWFSCTSDYRQVRLMAPHNRIAMVRCGLHAGSYDWNTPECQQT